jgi:hypothetical protein
MITNPSWRSLIYELGESSVNRKSLFFTYAIQKVSEQGYYNEIRNVAAVSSQMDIVVKLLDDLLQKLLEDGTTENLEAFLKIALYDERCFLFVITALKRIDLARHDPLIRRVIQEMFSSIESSDKLETAQKLSAAFSTKDRNYSYVNEIMTSIRITNNITTSDVISLYQIYVEPILIEKNNFVGNPFDNNLDLDLNKLPKLSLVMEPFLFDKLLHELYYKTINADNRLKYLALLTFISCVNSKLEFSDCYRALEWLESTLKQSITVDLSSILKEIVEYLR